MILDLSSEMEEIKKKKRAEKVKEWRKKNPEKYKKIQEKAMLKYRLKNKKKFTKNQLNYYYRNREEILRKMKEKRDREKQEKGEK